MGRWRSANSSDDNPDMVNKRDSVIIRLLHACIKSLAQRGMKALFFDAVKGGDEGLQSLGKARSSVRQIQYAKSSQVSRNGKATKKSGEMYENLELTNARSSFNQRDA